MKKLKFTKILIFLLLVNSFLFLQFAFAASSVDVIDSVVITEERDVNAVLAEWSAHDPNITVYKPFKSAQAVKLFINWSDSGGAVELNSGDYFTFVFPAIFNHDLIDEMTGVAVRNNSGDVVARYSIYENSDGMKELEVTFTDYVNTHSDISGDLWFLLFVGSVSTETTETLAFEINGELAAQGEVTLTPGTGTGNYSHPRESAKYGFSSPENMADGYYIFEWLVSLNMNENAETGFNVLEDFHFTDVIPQDSPHVFITDASFQIGEYTGSDAVSLDSRYPIFLERYYSTTDSWYDYIRWNSLANGLTSTGIDGQRGLNVSDLQITDKSISANLGTLTRPTLLTFYTISTIQISESALGDLEVAKLFENTFTGSSGQDLSATLTVYRFTSGGSAQGIEGDYDFTFTKVNESGDTLAGAIFSLYTDSDLSGGASRFAVSDSTGTVTFINLPAGTYYLRETTVPDGYIQNADIFMVELDSNGFSIYYGENYNTLLSDNRIVNESDEPLEELETTPESTSEPTPTLTPEPTLEPTPEPTPEPTAEPTSEPTPTPTPEPTPESTSEPTAEPTAEPTPEPTSEPTPEPTPEIPDTENETPSIEAPDNEPEAPEPPEPEQPEAPLPQTGKRNMTPVALALLAVSLMSIGLLINVRLRAKKND